MQPTLIVLAAGMGSRYGGLKQLDGVGPNGETIMDYSIYDAVRAGFGKVVFIIRNHFREAFEKTFATRYGNTIEVAFVEQEPDKELPTGFYPSMERTKPWGTAHAMLMAEPETNTPFAVINADDFYGREAYIAMGDFLRKRDLPTGRGQNHYAMVGYQIGKTLSNSGGVSRGICTVNRDALLTKVVERHHIQTTPEGKIIYEMSPGVLAKALPDTPVSMNFWGFTPDFFAYLRQSFRQFIQEHGTAHKLEFFIPTVVSRLIQEQQISVRVLATNASWVGITYQEDRPYVQTYIRQLIADGVYPNSIINT